MNVFVAALAEFCDARRFEEKRLIAPSRRIGNQWLDAAARAGRPALNVRVETLRSLAIELAAPELARRGVEVAPGRAEALVVDALLRPAPPGPFRYLGAAALGPGLSAAVHASISALRLQGVPAGRLRAGALEDPRKAADLRLLLERFAERLAALGLADYADVLAAAIERLAADPNALGSETLVLVPEDFAPSGLELKLLEALPAGRRVRLAVDPPGLPPQVRFACAVGEGNEARALLRRCLEQGIPFDEVEVLHCDPAYAEAIVEVFAAVARPGAEGPGDAVTEAPVTFAEGLPCTLSRPGRALAAWVAWMGEGYPQPRLVAMLREGLLEPPAADVDEAGEAAEGAGFLRLAALLRSIPIGAGRERYLAQIDEAVAAARRQLELAGRTAAAEADATAGADAELEESEAQRRERLSRRLLGLSRLRRLVARLLEVSPPGDAPAAALVAGAARFLRECSRSAGRFDAFAAERLREEIADAARWLGRAGELPPGEARGWLAALAAAARVGGSGPRPGCLHVDRVRSGGHSGRRHLVVVGLDDARFPGAGLQDPLLLDGERRRLDERMPTAAARLAEAVGDFRRLLGRQRGCVTLSWPSRAVVEDAERFPSQAVLEVFRDAGGGPGAALDDLLAAAGPPASFAPDAPERALDAGEWLLWRFTDAVPVENAAEVLARRAPQLARGLGARAARASDAFTPWDGRVPLAGADLDPAAPGGAVLSSNRLETAGACPRRFFYRYALGIARPDELAPDPSRWLEPKVAGVLLHELFEEYVRENLRAGRPAFDACDAPRLAELLEAGIERYRARYPVPSRAAFDAERDELAQAVGLFLRDEAQRRLETGAEPVYVEATLGMPPGEHGTPLDDPEPVALALPDGRSVRVRGRVDRVDRLPAAGGWEVWDYKSGSARNFDAADPFREARKIQPYLYWRMVEQRLRAVADPAAEVRLFGYFFPGARARGERLAWDAPRLAAGAEALAALCGIIASGAFAATTDHARDCAWCDYRTACGDVAAQAAASARKILAGDPLLATLARLRAESLAAPRKEQA